MASYTMELREYIEMWSQDNDDMSTRDRIETGRTKLFDFEYPLFSEEYRKDFETKFIRKFYMREIGFETEELFKFQLESWLLVNMPYFNKLFESELIEYDPLKNSEMTNTHTITKTKDETVDNTTDGTSNTTKNETKNSTVNQTKDTTNHQTNNETQTVDNFSRDLESNNPDSRLTITTNDGQGVIEYASSIKEKNENDSSTSNQTVDATVNDVVDVTGVDTVSGTGTGATNVTGNTTVDTNETENYTQNRVGKIGVQTYAKMVLEYRDTFLRIENQIFKEMQELFMLVY